MPLLKIRRCGDGPAQYITLYLSPIVELPAFTVGIGCKDLVCNEDSTYIIHFMHSPAGPGSQAGVFAWPDCSARYEVPEPILALILANLLLLMRWLSAHACCSAWADEASSHESVEQYHMIWQLVPKQCCARAHSRDANGVQCQLHHMHALSYPRCCAHVSGSVKVP